MERRRRVGGHQQAAAGHDERHANPADPVPAYEEGWQNPLFRRGLRASGFASGFASGVAQKLKARVKAVLFLSGASGHTPPGTLRVPPALSQALWGGATTRVHFTPKSALYGARQGPKRLGRSDLSAWRD